MDLWLCRPPCPSSPPCPMRRSPLTLVCFRSCFLRSPLSLVLVWHPHLVGVHWVYGLGFTAPTRFLRFLCTQCRRSTMPDWRIILIWRIILVQEFFSRPPSSSLSLVSALLSSHAPLIFAVHSEKTAGFNRLPRAGWTETCNSSDRTAWCQILGSFLLSYYPVMRVNDVASWTAGENRRFRGMTIGEVIIFPFPLCSFPLCRTLSSVEMLCPPWSLDHFNHVPSKIHILTLPQF